MKQFEQIYQKLYKIVPNLDKIEQGEAVKLKSEGFMDLNIDILYRDEIKNTTTIAMSHYYKHPSGDMIADPDMEIKIHHKAKMAEALTYQDSFGYRQVYPKEGGYFDETDRDSRKMRAKEREYLSKLGLPDIAGD